MNDLPDIDDLPDTIVPIRPAGSRPPLFCIHPVSGSAYLYLVLTDLLPADQPIYGIEASGYDDDQPPATSIPQMSAHYVSILREHWPHTPCYLLGWSLGGVVAIDMARRLTADGVEVPLVFMVDAEAPQRWDLPTERAMQYKFMHDLMAVADAGPPQLMSIFMPLPEDVDPTVSFGLVEESNILPPEVDAELLLQRYQIYRTHVAAIYNFEFDDVYPGPATHIRASETDPLYQKWGSVVSDLQEHTIVADHHSIWTGAALTELGAIVSSRLDEVQRRHAGA